MHPRLVVGVNKSGCICQGAGACWAELGRANAGVSVSLNNSVRTTSVVVRNRVRGSRLSAFISPNSSHDRPRELMVCGACTAPGARCERGVRTRAGLSALSRSTSGAGGPGLGPRKETLRSSGARRAPGASSRHRGEYGAPLVWAVNTVAVLSGHAGLSGREGVNKRCFMGARKRRRRYDLLSTLTPYFFLYSLSPPAARSNRPAI